jgi:ribosomal protein S18 acetylase RimI-like enzyme
MGKLRETASHQCRFLNDEYFEKLYAAFIEAFSDYVIPFALTETQFRNHIRLNAVDLARTVGCFDGERLIGFSLNGFGEWEGYSTVYDAGTGVIPGFRRQGISEAMFEMMMPHFKAEGFDQWLLEVICSNTAAIRLYEKLGFHRTRQIALLQCDGEVKGVSEKPPNVEIRDIDDPDWELLTTFWDGTTTWQNSVAAVNRSRMNKRVLGAFLDDECVGYIVSSGTFGRVAQLAVDKRFRGHGIGTALLRAIRAAAAEGFSLQIINLDKSIVSATNFFANRGFYEKIGQYEMTAKM